MQVFWVQTFLTQRLPSPIFFKLSIPGGLRIFRAFASLFVANEWRKRYQIRYGGIDVSLMCSRSFSRQEIACRLQCNRRYDFYNHCNHGRERMGESQNLCMHPKWRSQLRRMPNRIKVVAKLPQDIIGKAVKGPTTKMPFWPPETIFSVYDG